MKIHVKIIPGSKSNSIIYEGLDIFGNDLYRIKLIEIPQNGKANKALIEYLSDYFSIPKRDISIIGGKSSRDKIIDVNGLKKNG